MADLVLEDGFRQTCGTDQPKRLPLEPAVDPVAHVAPLLQQRAELDGAVAAPAGDLEVSGGHPADHRRVPAEGPVQRVARLELCGHRGEIHQRAHQ